MNILKEFFIRYFPFIIFYVHGKSMEPTLLSSSKVLGISTMFSYLKKNDIVICQDPRTKRILVKRVVNIKQGKYFVEGDNKENSTDSRVFGWLSKKDIFAKVIYPKNLYNR